jgi:hypothetical protein
MIPFGDAEKVEKNYTTFTLGIQNIKLSKKLQMKKWKSHYTIHIIDKRKLR